MLPSNISQAINLYDDGRFEEKNDAIYFDGKKIRCLYDSYYLDEKLRGYYYYNSYGDADVCISSRNDILHIQVSSKEEFRAGTDNLKNTIKYKKSKYDIVMYKKNMVSENLKQWIDDIKVTDNSLHIKEYNNRIFGYCQNVNGFGYSGEKGKNFNGFSIFANPYDDLKEDYILFSIPCKEYVYVQFEN